VVLEPLLQQAPEEGDPPGVRRRDGRRLGPHQGRLQPAGREGPGVQAAGLKPEQAMGLRHYG
jgi:hypothetical protein